MRIDPLRVLTSKPFMKNLFALLFIAIAGLSAAAQEQPPPQKTAAAPQPTIEAKKETTSKIEEPISICDLGLQHSPIVSGLQLRMSELEASLKVRGEFVADTSGAGTRKTVKAKFDKDPIFINIESAALTSVDGRVTSIRLGYTTKWTTVKDFVMDFGPKLGVVRSAFRIDREKNEAKITCKEFTIDLKAHAAGSEVILTDLTAGQKGQ